MKKLAKFVGGFFQTNSAQSMMRLCALSLVWGGMFITSLAIFLELSGAHYGLELAALGILGKAYQKTKEKKEI